MSEFAGAFEDEGIGTLVKIFYHGCWCVVVMPSTCCDLHGTAAISTAVVMFWLNKTFWGCFGLTYAKVLCHSIRKFKEELWSGDFYLLEMKLWIHWI